MIVSWVKCNPNNWCNLDLLNLDSVSDVTGVYLIWHGQHNYFPPRWVRVGQGDIGDRLSQHRNDPQVATYRPLGGLYVTWAEVSHDLLDGVEAYLGECCKPLVGTRFPDCGLIAVNLPQ